MISRNIMEFKYKRIKVNNVDELINALDGKNVFISYEGDNKEPYVQYLFENKDNSDYFMYHYLRCPYVNIGVTDFLLLITKLINNRYLPAIHFAGTLNLTGEKIGKNLQYALIFIKFASEAGYVPAQYDYGCMFKEGVGVSRNVNEALKWISLAAEQEYVDAQYELSCMYFFGDGITKNIEEARKWSLLAANQNHSGAQYNLGVMYFNGEGVPKNVEEAIKWFEVSAEQGYKKAQHNLGVIYDFGYGVAKNKKVAIEWYSLSSNQGVRDSQFNLGNIYFEGDGIEKNMYKAAKFYELAAKQGHKDAQFSLGMMYYSGDGIPKNVEEAIKWFNLSAEQGHLDAKFLLANIYYNGIGTEQDFKKAHDLFLQTLDDANLSALFLAVMYRKGQGVHKNKKESIKYIKLYFDYNSSEAEVFYEILDYVFEIQTNVKSFDQIKALADKNDAESQELIGIAYYYGIYEEQDITNSVKYIKLAAENGRPVAQYMLGDFYSDGTGVDEDEEEEIKWYELSAEQGYLPAQIALGEKYYCDWEYEKALKWLELAANNGLAYAQYLLGCIYYEELDERDEKEALKWLNLAAEQCDSNAQFKLGEIYNNSLSSVKDEQMAFKWYRMSAVQNNDEAQIELAKMYLHGTGTKKNIEEGMKWLKRAAELGNAKAQRDLGEIYLVGCYGVEFDLEESLKWYKLAFENGCNELLERIEALEKTINNNKAKNTLHFSKIRKDVFISWNHNDKTIKDELTKFLESKDYLTVWESDGKGKGEINDAIENAIKEAKCYIIIVSEKSIDSKWCQKEVQIILDNIERLSKNDLSINSYLQCIHPLYLNNSESLVANLDSSHPFYKLKDLCSGFQVEGKIDYESIGKVVEEAIDARLKLEYKEKIMNKFVSFSSALVNRVESTESKTGIIATALEFERGYIDRPLFLDDDVFEDDLFGLSKPILIYGEGGSGKTLYLKNMIRTQFISNRYLFYVPTKELEDYLDNEFIDILRSRFFDSYFSNGDYKKITNDSFESIFTSTNEIFIFVDALDELDEEKRTILFEKISKFNNKYENMHFIFTSRTKSDSSKITKYFNEEPIILQLRGINEEDIEAMYDSIDEKYVQKQDDDRPTSIESISKDDFFEKLEYLNDDIKKNPLLISNLIFIYFATKRIPTQSYEIINEAIDIMINDIEKERSVFFSYTSVLSQERLYEMLKYLSFCRALYDERKVSDIFEEFLTKKEVDVDDVGKASVEIVKYLRRRSILNGEQIAHNIFRDFFAASYLFDDVYLIKGEVPRKYCDFKNDSSKDDLDDYIYDYFQDEDNDWQVISCDLIFKLDYEIHNLNSRREMNERHLSFETFDYTLTKCLKEKGMHQIAIDTIRRLIETDGMYYGEFVKKYLS